MSADNINEAADTTVPAEIPEATINDVRKVEEAQKEVSKETIVSELKANFDNKVDIKSVDFRFRPIEDKETGVKSTRPRMTIQLPVPSVEGILDIITVKGGKELELLQEAVADVIERRAKDVLGEDNKWTITGQDSFPIDSILWSTIANLPKIDRRSSGIDEETWKEFAADYVAVMPAVTNKAVDKVTNATKLFLAKFTPLKGKKDYKNILGMLKLQLVTYMDNSPNAEKYVDCIDYLINRADQLIAAEDVDYSSNL